MTDHRSRFRRGVAVAALLTVLGAYAPAAAPIADAAPATSGARVDAEADRIVSDALKSGPFPGIGVAVERHGKVVYRKGFGFADLEKKIPVTPETRFPIGSITKSFTCLSIMQLVAKGDVGLDKTAGDYLPELPSQLRGIKIRNMLNHTSGIANYTDMPEFPHDRPQTLTRADVLKLIESKPLQFPSGDRFNYTNSDTFLLGLVIEKASGMDYRDYVRKHVFEPFGMSHTGFDAAEGSAPDRAHGYRLTADGFKPSTPYSFDVPFSAGGIVSTTGDLLKYREGVFGPKTGAKVRSLILTRDPLNSGRPLPYALGCLVIGRFEGHEQISHAGDIYGFAADYAYYPNDGLTIAILTNNQGASFPPITIEHRLARLFLGVPAPKLIDAALPADVAKAFEGDFAVGDFRFGFDTLGFVYKDGVLNMSIEGVKSGAPLLPLRYQGGGKFVSAIDDEHTFEFSRNADGSETVIMHYYDGAIGATKPPAK
jgi:CubicO group peptidase (beta-lactamase class C family)